MEKTNTKPSIQEVAKHPFAYLLMGAIGMIWFFIYQFSGATSQVNRNCEMEKTQLRIELTEERKKNNDLVNALLVKNGIIDQIKKNTDSLVKKKVGNEAKKIIENENSN